MKELFPIRSEGYMSKGGSTRPWKIVAVDPTNFAPVEVPYVLKLFKKKAVSDSHSIGKEFFCNKLASQFDLVTPEAAVIGLNDAFILTLDQDQKNDLQKKHDGYTYASRLCESATLLDEDLTRKLVSIQEIANVFAFDCLIFNIDRGGFRKKPNILIDDEGLILIDHELTLYFVDGSSDTAYKKLKKNLEDNIITYQFDKHQFYPILKAYRGSKKDLMGEFEELLKRLNIGELQEYLQLMEGYNISIGQSDALIDYLCFLKQRAHNFSKAILGLIL